MKSSRMPWLVSDPISPGRPNQPLGPRNITPSVESFSHSSGTYRNMQAHTYDLI